MLLNFDYDGVIANSFEPLLALTIQTQKLLGFGRPPTSEDFRSLENLSIEGLGRHIGLSEDLVSHYVQKFFELQKQKWSVEVFPDIVPVFHELSQQHKLVVITASQSDAVAETLETSGLDSTISKVFGGEIGLTKAERIRMSCEAFQIDHNNVFMIGDTISDIRQGKLAQAQTVAVTWGFQNQALLKKENPYFIIDKPRDLLRIIT